jgi:iron complex transport system substrate-binding protein
VACWRTGVPAPQLVHTLEARLADVRNPPGCLPKHPSVFFEECDDPRIFGIEWVLELVETAGGIGIFADCASQAAKSRVVTVEGWSRGSRV